MQDMKERLKTLRLKSGLTLEDVGKILGLTKATISKYETGECQNMKRSTIKKLAEYYGVAPSYLMGYDSEEQQVEEQYNTYIETLRTNRGMRILFDSAKNATPEELEKVVKIIEALKDNK